MESDFVDIEGFSSMQDTTSLPELNLVGQVGGMPVKNYLSKKIHNSYYGYYHTDVIVLHRGDSLTET